MRALDDRDGDRRASSSVSQYPSTAAIDEGLCRVRDVLPDVLKRYGMAWPEVVAPALGIFVGHSTAEQPTSAACLIAPI
jgi:hypothetical protein